MRATKEDLEKFRIMMIVVFIAGIGLLLYAFSNFGPKDFEFIPRLITAGLMFAICALMTTFYHLDSGGKMPWNKIG